MAFNVMARNLDDHSKNISYLMTPDGKWRLSPAYDVIYAHNPAGQWTSRHQMSLNGKRDRFERADLAAVAEAISLSKPGALLDEIADTIRRWPEFAQQAGVNEKVIREIADHHALI
jgi:serine/threonine-protein kinase HipA